MEYKKLYRVNDDRIIGGVSGGLAEYFGLDTSIIRLIFIAISLLGGFGALIYLMLWIALPLDKEEITYKSDSYNPIQENTTTMNNPTENNTQQQETPSKDIKKHDRNRTIYGIILIVLGGLFLLDRMVPRIHFRDIWPILLILIGVIMILNNYRNNEKR